MLKFEYIGFCATENVRGNTAEIKQTKVVKHTLVKKALGKILETVTLGRCFLPAQISPRVSSPHGNKAERRNRRVIN